MADLKETIRSPFPWFGGKSRVAALCWKRFGNVQNYVEPFFGSGAMLLGRPHWPFDPKLPNRTETVNDLDCFVANFWRCLQVDPEQLASYADWPVNEADLHARHLWLTNNAEFRRLMHSEPDYCDYKVAGWWVWGICQWIGSGWCEHPEWQQRPHLGDAGMGIHRPSQQRPHLGRGMRYGLYEYFALLADRLRNVRVCCGDWTRVLSRSPTDYLGTTAVFLDPPYSAEAGRDESLYAQESLSVAHDVREWAIANGDNPDLLIALCGYDSEHVMPESWECVAWKTNGGYASHGSNPSINRHRERIWFSPACIKVERQRSLIE